MVGTLPSNVKLHPEHSDEEYHAPFMAASLREARKSVFVEGAFCVGAVLVLDGKIVSTGYSRELPGNTHAEQCAFEKFLAHHSEEDLKRCTIYTTMEPCSIRLSGHKTCCTRILEYGVPVVVAGAMEPPDYVQNDGIVALLNAGVKVIYWARLHDEIIAVARGQQAPVPQDT